MILSCLQTAYHGHPTMFVILTEVRHELGDFSYFG